MKLAENKNGRRPSRQSSLSASTPRVIVSLLLWLCLQGCGANSSERSESAGRPGANVSANAPTPRPASERNEAVKEEFLINARQIGRARLGVPFGELKNIFPGATFHIVTVRPDKTSDIAVRHEGRDILFVRTRAMDETTLDELPQSSDPIRSLMTGDARFTTAAGIHPGSSLDDAIKAYGTPELFYQPPTEFAAFNSQGVDNLSFHLAGASANEPAGVYRMSPEGMEDGWYKSKNARPGSRILFIAIIEM